MCLILQFKNWQGLKQVFYCGFFVLFSIVVLICISPITSRLPGTSLVAQSLRTRLPMQGTRVPPLDREDPTCSGATKPVHHNY